MIPAKFDGRTAKRATHGVKRKAVKVYLLPETHAKASRRAAALASSISLYIEGLIVRDLERAT